MTLPPSQLAIEPGDMIETQEAGLRLLHRVTSVTDEGARKLEALSIDPAVYDLHAAPRRPQDAVPSPVVGTADAVFLDLPIIAANGIETAGYVALHQAPWPGPMALYRSPERDGFELATLVHASATIGALVDPLPSAPPGRWDHATQVRVRLASGSLRSESRLAVYDGANAIGVHRDDGSWEICQFERAELVAPLTYALSGFLRGQQGTEDRHAIGTAIAAAGQPVVLIDATLAAVPVGEVATGRPLHWRYGPANRDIGHTTYSQANHAFSGVARRPFAPVHIRGTRAAGDITITWVRRTRVGGDSWAQAEVAIGEQTEAYQVDILKGGDVVRTLETATPAVTYGAAHQVADFGAEQAAVRCRVYQMSATWGRGRPRSAVI